MLNRDTNEEPRGKTLDSNDQNQVADQRFSLKQWFAGGAQSRGLRKPGYGHCYLRFFNIGYLVSRTQILKWCFVVSLRVLERDLFLLE